MLARVAATRDPRELWLEPWPQLRGRADLGHLARPSALLRVLRLVVPLGTSGHLVVYDVRRLTETVPPGLVEPCQMLEPAALRPWTRWFIAAIETVSRRARRPRAVVVYAA